jgi:hypothetical protein
MLYISSAGFAGGSLIAALARNFNIVLVGRTVQVRTVSPILLGYQLTGSSREQEVCHQSIIGEKSCRVLTCFFRWRTHCTLGGQFCCPFSGGQFSLTFSSDSHIRPRASRASRYMVQYQRSHVGYRYCNRASHRSWICPRSCKYHERKKHVCGTDRPYSLGDGYSGSICPLLALG